MFLLVSKEEASRLIHTSCNLRLDPCLGLQKYIVFTAAGYTMTKPHTHELQVSMELEHAIGFSGNLRKCLFFHPNGRDIGMPLRSNICCLVQKTYLDRFAVYAAGGCVVVADLSDPHNQARG